MNSTTLKPFAKKSFYLDLKGYPLELKLAKDLKLLGGKQETFLSKDVSFVVSNRISAKPNSVSSQNSWSNCAPVSPHLFNESARDFTDSPTNVSTLNLESNFATPVSRGISLVQKARQKAGINHQSVKHGTADILENCKLWNIKVYDVKKVLSWVEKYKNLYHKKYAAELKEQQKKLKTNNENVKKLQAPYIKVDDCKRKYQSRYKEVLYSTDMLNILAKVKEINSQFCQGNKVNKKPPRFVLRELNNKSTQFTQPKAVQSLSVSASITSLCPPASNCIYTSNRRKDMNLNPALKRKGKDCKKKSKKKFCEICDVYFCDLDEHLATKQHEIFMKNVTHYEAITEIISKFSNVPQFSRFGKNMDFNNFQAPIKEKLYLSTEQSNPKLNSPFSKTQEKPILYKEKQLFAHALDTEKQLMTLQNANIQGFTEHSAVAESNGKDPAIEGFCEQKMSGAFHDVDLLCKESLNFTESEPLSFHAPKEQCHLIDTTNMATEVSNILTTCIADNKTLNSGTVVTEPLLENVYFCDPFEHSVEALSANELGKKSVDAFVCYENYVPNEGFNYLGCNTLLKVDDPEAAFPKNCIGMEMQMTNDAKLFSVNCNLEDSPCFVDKVHNERYANELESVQKGITGASTFSDAKEIKGNLFEAISNCTECVENRVTNSLGIVSANNIPMLFKEIQNQVLIQTTKSNNIQKESSIPMAERESEIIFQNNTDEKNLVNFLSSNMEDGLALSNHPHQFAAEEVNNQSRNNILLTDNEYSNNGKNTNELKQNVSSNVLIPPPVLVDNLSVENLLLQNETATIPLLEVERERDENKAKYEDLDMPKLQVCCELKGGEDNYVTEIVNEVESEYGTELYDLNDDIVSASYSSDDTELVYLEDTSGMLEACEVNNVKNKRISLEAKSKYSFKTVALQKSNINEKLFFGVENKNFCSPTHEEQNKGSVRVHEERNDHCVQSAVSFNSSILDQKTGKAIENGEYYSLKENERIEYSSKHVKLIEENNNDGKNNFLGGCLLNEQETDYPLQPLNLVAETEANNNNLDQNVADFPSQVYKTCSSKEDSSKHFGNDPDVAGLHKKLSSFEERLIHFRHDKLNGNVIEQVTSDSGTIDYSLNKEQTSSSKSTELCTKPGMDDKISNFSVSNGSTCELSTSAKNTPINKIDCNRNFENCSVVSNMLSSTLPENKLCNLEHQKLGGGYDTILLSNEIDRLPNEHSLHGEQAISPIESPHSVNLDRSTFNQNCTREKLDNFPGPNNESYLIRETENDVLKNALSVTDDSCYLSVSDCCLNLSKSLDSSKCVETCSLSVNIPLCAKNDDSGNVIEADFNSDYEEDEEWLEIQSDIDSACKSLSEETNTYAVDLSINHEKLNDVPVLLQC